MTVPPLLNGRDDPTTEAKLLASLSLDAPWALVERFTTLVRESGTDAEREAARYVAERLEAFGVPHRTLEAELFLSLPRRASVRLHDGSGAVFEAATPAFSTSTGPAGQRGSALHIATGYAKTTMSVFDAGDAAGDADLSGRVVVTEGFANPGKVRQFQLLGAAGVVCINPGAYVHQGICTPIWGAPDLDNHEMQPRIPVTAISRPDGDVLLAALARGPVDVTLETELDEGWRSCPLVVAEVRGSVEPEKFVLLHGHIDSWFEGIGDNATGNATLLEIARVLQQHRGLLKRSVRICWWPGHSTGRYAGSTWYADRFGLDLDANCIAHVNCDSPGCRDATAYENVMWMAEAEPLALSAIHDATGQGATGARPFRAGDISFNNLGISTFFMLSSEIPAEELRARQSYPVGGCGMNIEWHTPYDTLEIADRDILMKDMRVYLLGTLRAANAPVTPLDFRRTVAEVRGIVERYAAAAGDHADLSPALAAAARLAERLERLYARTPADDAEARRTNETLRRVGRRLVSVNYTRAGKFRQDPALQGAAVPDLAAALEVGGQDDLHLTRVTRTHLQRGVNHVTHELDEAALAVANHLAATADRG